MDRFENEGLQHRGMESRSLELRKSEIRKKMQMNFKHNLDFDPSEIPEGMEYKWVTAEVYGSPTGSKMQSARKAGWVPVPATNHPDRTSEILLDRKHHLDGYIHDRGLVLCMRDLAYGEVEREMEAEELLARMLATPGLQNTQVPIKVSKNDVGIQRMQSFKD